MEAWLKPRDRDFITISETRDLKFCHHFWLEFFHISGIFPTYFGCFLPANRTNKQSLNYWNLNKLFFCNIQSLEICSLRDRDQTWIPRDRDCQNWVSRDAITNHFFHAWSMATKFKPNVLLVKMHLARKFEVNQTSTLRVIQFCSWVKTTPKPSRTGK